jgi:hypothetical protein
LTAAVVETGYACNAFAAGDSGGEDNFLADLDGSDVGANLGDFASDVAAGNVWERDWNIWQTTADPEVEMIQCAGTDAHEDFVGAEGWSGGIGVLQYFWSTVLMK